MRQLSNLKEFNDQNKNEKKLPRNLVGGLELNTATCQWNSFQSFCSYKMTIHESIISLHYSDNRVITLFAGLQLITLSMSPALRWLCRAMIDRVRISCFPVCITRPRNISFRAVTRTGICVYVHDTKRCFSRLFSFASYECKGLWRKQVLE